MVDDYARLFNARGHRYHEAMTRFPHARDAEFAEIVALSGVAPGDRIADIPCGGGYLAGYLPAGITLHSIDSSDVFADCFRRTGGHRFLQCPIDQVPLQDASLDQVLSIAGLHHVADRRPFWHECARLLRPGGVLTVADVARGSRIDRFLDGTVDRYTPTGHHGIYFDETTVSELEAAGFRDVRREARRVGWRAPDRLALAMFCRLLFGLERIDDESLADILARDVGVRDTGDGIELDWELLFFRAVRR